MIVLVTARGTSTHSSMPRPDNAIFTLSRAMAKLSQLRVAARADAEHPAVSAGACEDERRRRMSGYFRTLADGTNPAAVTRADAEVSKDPLLHAIMRTHSRRS